AASGTLIALSKCTRSELEAWIGSKAIKEANLPFASRWIVLEGYPSSTTFFPPLWALVQEKRFSHPPPSSTQFKQPLIEPPDPPGGSLFVSARESRASRREAARCFPPSLVPLYLLTYRVTRSEGGRSAGGLVGGPAAIPLARNRCCRCRCSRCRR